MRYEARIRVPAAIDGAVVGPYTDRMLVQPDDGELLDHAGDDRDGTVRVAFDADDDTDARMHATALSERVTGGEVLDVRPAAS